MVVCRTWEVSMSIFIAKDAGVEKRVLCRRDDGRSSYLTWGTKLPMRS